MAMRLSGLMSGMDTDSVIKELVSVKQKKVDDAKKAQKKLSWKQDAWKDLNSKLKSLQTKYLNTMRYSDAYTKKTTKVSNSNVVSVLTGESAVNGVQELKVSQLAKTAYLTGAKISGGSAGDLTALSKLSDIKDADGNSVFSGGSGTFTVRNGSKSVDISINDDTTISDVLNSLKNAGLNASFDVKQQRFFVSAKESGAANDFSIVASDAVGSSALSALGLQASLKDDAATLAEYEKYAEYYAGGDRDAALEKMRSLIDGSVQSRVDIYTAEYKKLADAVDAAQKRIDEINDTWQNEPGGLLSAEEYGTQLEAKNAEITAQEEALKNLRENGGSEEEVREAEEKLTSLKEEASILSAKKRDAEDLAAQEKAVTDAQTRMTEITDKYVDISSDTDADGNTIYSGTARQELITEEENKYFAKAEYAYNVMQGYDPDTAVSTGATKINGQDAIIELNGAEFTSESNVFEINGLTLTALATTEPGETVTVSTQTDTDGIYDMIKDFLKEYNAVINEMDKLYNADLAKGYEPLTEEEKDSMSESEVEEWEKKIKDSLLRRDSNVSSVSSALKEIMAGGVMVNGKRMYLSDFGISTLGYFESADNEKNAYHIDGNEDDEFTSAKTDKLKAMITNDPDTVVSFFSQLTRDLYSKMTDLSKSVNGYRSFGSFYDDKKMKDEYNDYTSKIAELEQKLNDYEDKWYAKFAAMETAMAKMQGNANAVMSLLGG